MIKTSLKIEGMMCGMCEAHVSDVIRRAVPSAKKVSVSRSSSSCRRAGGNLACDLNERL